MASPPRTDATTPEARTAGSSSGAAGGARRLLDLLLRSRAWRANGRLAVARGNILSAGIAFYGVFSLFPLLVLGVTVFGQLLRSDERLQESVFGYARSALPGLIAAEGEQTSPGSLPLSPELVLDQGLDPTTVGLSALLGVAVLLFTALGWISALREGIRSVFRMPVMQVDLVRAKLFDLAVALTLGVLLVASAGVSVVASSIMDQLLRTSGLDGSGASQVVGRVLVFVTAAAVDTLLFMVLYRVLAGARPRYRGLVTGALLAALGVGVLRQLVSEVLGNVGGSFSFLAAFVPILALFVWLNLTARVMLFGAAWAAVGPGNAEIDPARTVPERVPLPRQSAPVLPRRWSDRALLGAGAVLGASCLGLLQVSTGAVRAVGQGVRTLVRD